MERDRRVGQRLKDRREALGLSVEELAIACGVRVGLFEDYETGTRRLTAARLRQLADLLEVPLTYFDPPIADGPADA